MERKQPKTRIIRKVGKTMSEYVFHYKLCFLMLFFFMHLGLSLARFFN